MYIVFLPKIYLNEQKLHTNLWCVTSAHDNLKYFLSKFLRWFKKKKRFKLYIYIQCIHLFMLEYFSDIKICLTPAPLPDTLRGELNITCISPPYTHRDELNITCTSPPYTHRDELNITCTSPPYMHRDELNINSRHRK